MERAEKGKENKEEKEKKRGKEVKISYDFIAFSIIIFLYHHCTTIIIV